MHYQIYTKDDCSYCHMAKQALTTLGIGFSEQKLHRDFTRDQILEKFPNARTFPIIVVDGFAIGGYNELKEHLAAQTGSSKILLNE